MLWGRCVLVLLGCRTISLTCSRNKSVNPASDYNPECVASSLLRSKACLVRRSESPECFRTRPTRRDMSNPATCHSNCSNCSTSQLLKHVSLKLWAKALVELWRPSNRRPSNR